MADPSSTSTRGPLSRANNAPDTGNPSKRPPVRWKAADRSWHPLVQDLYNSLKKSEHADEFQPTDVALARVLAETHSGLLYSPEPNGSLMKTILDQWKDFGVSLGSRRRLALEAQRVEEVQNTAAILADLATRAVYGNPAGNP